MKEKVCPSCGTLMNYIGKVDDKNIHQCKDLNCGQELEVLILDTPNKKEIIRSNDNISVSYSPVSNMITIKDKGHNQTILIHASNYNILIELLRDIIS